MRIFIVGAGAVGSTMAAMLAKEKRVREVICGDRDTKRARQFLKPGGKISLVKANAASAASIAAGAKGCDVIVNASLRDFNLIVMSAALTAKAHYQDLDSHLLDLKHAEQLQMHKAFKKAGRTGLINAGVSPGVTNLLAREAAERMGSVDSIRIRLIEDQRAEKQFFSWSPRVTLDEVSSAPLVYRKRRFALTEPFADEEEYEFPAPIGRRKVVSIYGDEVATIPLYVKTRNVDYKACGADIEFARTLRDLGMLGTEKVRVAGKRVRPFDVLAKVAPPVPTPMRIKEMLEKGELKEATLAAAVDVRGKLAGKTVRQRCMLTFPDMKTIAKRAPGATYVAYATAVSAASFALLVPKIGRPGVFPPEALEKKERTAVLARLRREGISVGCRAS